MANDVLIYNTTAVDAVFTTNMTVASSVGFQSAVMDFGTPRAANWLCRLSAALSAAPVAGAPITVYMGWSTASNAGFAGVLGTGAASHASTGLPQLEFIGQMNCRAVDTLQIQDVGLVFPKLQYGIVVINNGTAQSIQSGTIASVTFTPIKDQIQ